MASSHPATDLEVPRTQKAAIFEEAGKPVRIIEQPVVQASELKPGQVLVKIIYSGVCHTDLHAARGEFSFPVVYPLVGGHEGAGFIVAIGTETETRLKIGQAVGVKWLANSCLSCESCARGNEPICKVSQVTGISMYGTFQQYVVSYASHVTPIPESVPLHEAAPILCAGVTVYKAIKQANTQPGDIVVISGAGGGLGHLGIQYAVNGFGLRVIAIDTGSEKRELCQKLGAEAFIDFKESTNVVEDVRRAADGEGAHVVVVTSGSSAAYDLALKYLRAGGTLMAVGAPPDAEIRLGVTMAIGLSITIKGSYVGSREDARQALDLVARGRVKTTYHIEPLDKLQDVLDGLQSGTFAGRVVLDMWK